MNTHDIELPEHWQAFQYNEGWGCWEQVIPSAANKPGVVKAYTADQVVAAIEAALRPEVTEFELIQDGIPVAGASGKREDAWREIQHYAAQYSEDGPVEIYEVIRRRIEGEGE